MKRNYPETGYFVSGRQYRILTLLGGVNLSLIPLDGRAAKKAAVLGHARKNRLAVILVLCAVVIGGAGVFLMLNSGGGEAVSVEATVSAETVGDQVSYPASLFADGRARHFELKHEDMTIRYFVLKSSDGVIRAAFDACDVCWSAGKPECAAFAGRVLQISDGLLVSDG